MPSPNRSERYRSDPAYRHTVLASARARYDPRKERERNRRRCDAKREADRAYKIRTGRSNPWARAEREALWEAKREYREHRRSLGLARHGMDRGGLTSRRNHKTDDYRDYATAQYWAGSVRSDTWPAALELVRLRRLLRKKKNGDPM